MPDQKGLEPRQAALEFLRSGLRIAGALLLAAGGLIGFVALAGSVIVWSRFSAAGIPADQVVAAYPRGELVAIASSLLMLFGLVGALSVVAFYLIDRAGRPTLGTARGLLGLLGVEGLAVILLIADSDSNEQAYLAGSCFAMGLVFCAWVTFIFERRTVYADWKWLKGEKRPRGMSRSQFETAERWPLMRHLKWAFFEVFGKTVVFTGLVVLIVGFASQFSALLVMAGLGFIAIVPSVWLTGTLWWRPQWGFDPKIDPYRLPFERGGMFLIFLVLIPTVVVPALIFQSPWLWGSLAAAACLIGGLWRAALLSKGNFLWFGIAIFASVPLYGTLNWMIQNVAEPQVQPMALIRKADGANEYLQGLYVTQTDDRVYFATVATQGCKGSLVHDSGRLLWVPKSEVAAMAIGSLQDVASARKQALEMSYALAPAAENATETGSQLSVAGPEAAEGNSNRKPPPRRLEGQTVAVEPAFGAGLYLDPPVAAPGEIVSLRMTRPAKSTHGFGSSRHRRTLRLGGVPVDIIKEPAATPWRAEYAETEEGRVISLRKHTLYRRVGKNGPYEEITDTGSVGPGMSNPVFVRVADRSVRGAHGPKGVYLKITWPKDEPVHLAPRGGDAQRVTIGTESVELSEGLLRQAWDKDRIQFRVPEGAESGSVTIDCSQLVGAPVMHVRALEARIAVTIEPGSNRIRLDSTRSRDASGRIVSRDWSIQGLESGHGAIVSRGLPISRSPYSIKLTVTDSNGLSDTARIRLMRISASSGATAERVDDLSQLISSSRRAFSGEPPASIEFDAHPGPTETAGGRHPDRHLAKELHRKLFEPATDLLSGGAGGPQGIGVRTLDFDPACPAAAGDPDGRVDVLVVTDGVDMVSQDHCSPVAAESTRSTLALRP